MENLLSQIAHLKGLRITRSYLTCAHTCVCSGTTWHRMGSVNSPHFQVLLCEPSDAMWSLSRHMSVSVLLESTTVCHEASLSFSTFENLHGPSATWCYFAREKKHFSTLYCESASVGSCFLMKKRFLNFQNWTESEDNFRRQMPKITQTQPSGLLYITGSGQRKRA